MVSCATRSCVQFLYLDFSSSSPNGLLALPTVAISATDIVYRLWVRLFTLPSIAPPNRILPLVAINNVQALMIESPSLFLYCLLKRIAQPTKYP